MPVTCFTFLVGVLAIAGAGIPALWMPNHMPFGLGGYFSKDEILAVAWHRVYGAEHHGAAAGEHAASVPGLRDSGIEGLREDNGRVVLASYTEEPTARGHDSEAPQVGEATGEHAEDAAAAHVGGHAGAFEKPGPAWLWLALFWVPVGIAYVTPFYMMRAWWLTFMGKPRDHHVYDHAHESPLMWLPLVVLAVGTFVASYVIFRPLVAAAAPAGLLTQVFDGAAGSASELAPHATMIDHGAHAALAKIVGFAFVAGFFVAIVIYARGLVVGEKLKRAFLPLHTVLEHKFYFDELYGAVFVGGTHVLKNVSYAFDKYVVDGLVNLSAWLTERISAFSGYVLDKGLVDGLVNGVGAGTMKLGGLVRSPQIGRVRNYILCAAGSAAVVVVWIAFG